MYGSVNKMGSMHEKLVLQAIYFDSRERVDNPLLVLDCRTRVLIEMLQQ